MVQFIFWLVLTIVGFATMTISGYYTKDSWDKVILHKNKVNQSNSSNLSIQTTPAENNILITEKKTSKAERYDEMNIISQTGKGVSIDEVINTLTDKNLTNLQRSQFVKRHNGQYVQWGVCVKDVSKSFQRDPLSDIFLIFIPVSQKEEHFPKIIIASFSHSAEADLASLGEGDIVNIGGKLSFSESGFDWNFSLKESKLISISKKK